MDIANNNIVHIDPKTNYQCEFDIVSIAKDLSDDPPIITSNIIILECITVHTYERQFYIQSALLLSNNNSKYCLIHTYRHPEHEKECKWKLSEKWIFWDAPIFGVKFFDEMPTYDEFKEFKSSTEIESALDDDEFRTIKYEVFKDNLNRLTYSQFDLDLD